MTGNFSNANFDSDGDHFLHCPEDSTVQIDVVAKFKDGTDCDGECDHGTRSYTWSVSGASSYTIDGQTDGVNKSFITVTLGEAGDSISIQCVVSDLTQGACEEDRYGDPTYHGGSHDGATASCTIKLWRLDMEVSAPAGDVDPNTPSSNKYTTTFADSITTRGVLVGAAPIAASGGNHPWSWESKIDNDSFVTMVDASSWVGKIVAETEVEVVAKVINGCDSLTTDSAGREITINPETRRAGWNVPTYSNISNSSNFQQDPSGFPGLGSEIYWGLNTNSNAEFAESIDDSKIVVTPIYSDLATYPTYYANFDNVSDDITSGPNIGLWYNSSPSIYRCDRKAFINYWLSAPGKPAAVPSTGPPGSGVTSFDNYHDLYVQMNDDECGCANPSAHDGVGGNYRYRSTIWHETIGCPDSDNQQVLGHHVLMTDAILDDPNTYDPVWQADLRWAKTQNELRGIDAGIQSVTSLALLGKMNYVHVAIAPLVELHNFYGSNWFYTGSQWESRPGPYYGGW